MFSTEARTTVWALRAGSLFDGERVLGPGMVLIEDRSIKDVDTTGAEPPRHAVVLDMGKDAWILPGLIDTHVHLAFDATPAAAEACGLATSKGRLQPGMDADLLVLGSDPVTDMWV